MTLESTKERVVIASETSYQISYLKTSKVGPKEEKEYSLKILNFQFGWVNIAVFSLVGGKIHLKGYMANSYGFKIPKDDVAHYLPLAAIADIAESALVESREHEVIIEEFKKKI